MSNKLVEEYKKFDFEKHDDFQKFLKEMQPPVPKEAMELVKRHWYKRFINEDFIPNFDGSLPDLDDIDEQEHTHDGKKCTGQHNHSHSNKSSNQPESGFFGKVKRIAYSLENYMKMMFMMTTFWMQGIAHYISIFICILAIIRQLKRPRLTKQYVQQLAQNQFAQNLIYMLVFCFYRDQRNFFYFFPFMVHFWIGICEYLNIMKNPLFKKGESLINRTRQSKDNLFLLKSQFEIFYLPVLFVEIFFGRSSIFLVLFYYNFIKIKYLINPSTQLAFSKINNGIKGVLNAPGVPSFIGSMYGQVEKLFGWLVKHEPSKKATPPTPPAQPETTQKKEETIETEKTDSTATNNTQESEVEGKKTQ